MLDFSRRAEEFELMDDTSRPDAEFADAYRELASINRRLGGIRAIERFLPTRAGLLILDVAAGGCDIGDALTQSRGCQVVSLDLNARGLSRSKSTLPVVGDGLRLPFRNGAFDVAVCSLSFHHMSNTECEGVLREMWRVARERVIVNDLHRHPLAYASISLLAQLFSKSIMVKNDGPVSVRRAFNGAELREVSRRAGIPGQVHRSFPYRLVLVAEK